MKRLADLERRCCRWPIAEDAGGHWFCSELALSGLVYCRPHFEIAWRKAKPVNSADDTMKRIMDASAAAGQRALRVAAAERHAGADHQQTSNGVALTASAGDLGGGQPFPVAQGLRPIESMDLRFEAELTAPPTGPPIFEDIDPRTLLVEEIYQRGLSEQSIKLITRIASGWDWRKFRPPVVVFTPDGIAVVDGQHTSVAAASRPDIATIPCQVIEANEVAERAKAFAGLNADRLGMSQMQLHRARVAAADEDALTIEQVCQRAGVALVHNAFGKRAWKPGETVAISAITGLIQRRHAAGARQILEVLVRADCAPVSAAGIKAVEHLLHEPEFADEIESHEALSAAIAVMGDDALADAKRYAADHHVPTWRGLASVWFRKTRKKRKVA